MKLDKIIAVRNNKTVYCDGDKCIKVFNEDFSKADVLNEALNQARIEATSPNIPKILGVTMIDDKWAIISQYIKGKTLAQLMEENPEKRNEYLGMFVNLQVTIHESTCSLLNNLKDKLNRKICAANLDATTRYDLHMRLENMLKHNNVCHGDFNPTNIIVSDNGTPYILDWAHATQGDASADVAQTYLLFRLNYDIDIARRYLDLIYQKSNISKQDVQKWIPIIAAAQSVDSSEKEKERLLSWVDAIDVDCE